MNVSDATPQFAMDMTTLMVYSILNENPSTEVAVLTCLRKTTRALQKAVALRMGLGNKVLRNYCESSGANDGYYNILHT